MSLVERVQKDMVRSMKERDALRTSVLRMIKAAFKNREIENRGGLSEAEAIACLKTLLKQRTESIEQFEAGGRHDLAEKERQERKMIESYLPESISVGEMEEIVSAVIRETGASGPRDVGVVMKQAMAALQATGKTVDGKSVNALVRSRLEGAGKATSA